MQKVIKGLCFLSAFLIIFNPSALPAQDRGLNLTLPIIKQDPSKLHGYRASFWYQPASLSWRHYAIYVDASIGHWWINYPLPHSQINIAALAPVLRLYFAHTQYLDPYIELSVGPAYLSETRIENRNLGMHFAFQDQIAVGGKLGKDKQLAANFAILHYSNAGLSNANAGITIPLVFNVSYRFD